MDQHEPAAEMTCHLRRGVERIEAISKTSPNGPTSAFKMDVGAEGRGAGASVQDGQVRGYWGRPRRFLTRFQEIARLIVGPARRFRIGTSTVVAAIDADAKLLWPDIATTEPPIVLYSEPPRPNIRYLFFRRVPNTHHGPLIRLPCSALGESIPLR